MKGIYCYRDLKNGGRIVYIGKDSNISKKKRYYRHKTPSAYNEQHINRVIQNNPERYQYEVLKQFDGEKYNKELLNALEILYIKRYNPKFNFTKGGEGTTGLKGENHPLFKKEARVSGNGKNGYNILANGTEKICNSKDKLFLEKLCTKINSGEIDTNEAKRLNKANRSKNLSLAFKNKKHSKKWADNQSNTRNKTGFFRVSKKIDKQKRKGYIWAYRLPNKNKYITSNDIFKLKQKITANNLEWKIIDIDKAINTIKGECKFVI